MKKYWWLNQKDYEWCISAEKNWLQRLSRITAHADSVAEAWREEMEYKERWKIFCVW